jgi:hypothetical protein
MELFLNNIINYIENKGATMVEELIDFFPKADRDSLKHFIETGEIEEPEQQEPCTRIERRLEQSGFMQGPPDYIPEILRSEKVDKTTFLNEKKDETITIIRAEISEDIVKAIVWDIAVANHQLAFQGTDAEALDKAITENFEEMMKKRKEAQKNG